MKAGLRISVVSHGGDMRIERSSEVGPPFPSHAVQPSYNSNVFDETNSVTLLATNGHR